MSVMDSNKRLQYVDRLTDPPVARALFGKTRWAWIWLLVRLYVGYTWLSSGIGKLGSAAWTGENAGAAVTGFVQGALALTEGARPQVLGWYGRFLEAVVLPNATTFSYLVVAGELLVGTALVLGIFTGIAALFGSFMNASFLLAGTAGINPVLLTLEILLILAWKVAGWWGLDRWVLPALGTPWRPGLVFERGDEVREGPVVEEPGPA